MLSLVKGVLPFFGAYGTLFFFSCSSLSSMSANPIGRFHDQDSHEQLRLLSWIVLFTSRVCWLSGMAVGDSNDSEEWGLHMVFISLSIPLVLLGMK